MAPIKVGIIGLSSTATTSWASGAHLPYLLSERGRSKYQIVALLNSSISAAQAAIGAYGLGTGTRAYGAPEELAADDQVQLVVDVTRVDRHFPTAIPSIRAGKQAFIEWPLADSIEHVRELAKAARETGIRTAVGLQGRLTPVFLKVRAVIESGQLGKVLSSEVRGFGGSNSRDTLPVGLKYFTAREIGGNTYTIGFGHCKSRCLRPLHMTNEDSKVIDSVLSVLGEVQKPHTNLQIQRPETKIREPSTGEIIGTATSNVPDLIILTGSLLESEFFVRNATLLVRYRRGQPFQGEPAFVWTINGEKAELRLVAPSGTSLQADAYAEPVTLHIHDFATDKITTVEWNWPEWQQELPIRARSIAALYEAFANGDESKYANFEDALKRHEQLEEWIGSLE